MVKKSRQGAESKMGAQAPGEITREDALALLLRIAMDGKSDISDRLNAVKIHSTWLGYELTESQIWTVIGVLADGGTGSQ
jgi:hypothetical protein